MNINQAITESLRDSTRRITIERPEFAPTDSRRFNNYVVKQDDLGYFVKPGRGGGYKCYVTGFNTIELSSGNLYVFNITPHWEMQS